MNTTASEYAKILVDHARGVAVNDGVKWSDVFSCPELAAAVRLHAAKIAKQSGDYGLSGDLRMAAEALEQMHEEIEEARKLVARLVDQIGNLMKGLKAIQS